jgi:hypothetical protein
MLQIILILLAQLILISGLRMAMDRNIVLKPFREGNALKIISGLHNLNEDSVRNVVSAANAAGASHVDIACDASLVRMAKSVCSLPICVSSIKPKEFVTAVAAGADMVEIGNFDGFYESGLQFTAADVIAITKETRALLPHIPLSVTIPHTLSLPDQIELAKAIEAAGADIIQTEGKMSLAGRSRESIGILELIELAAPSLAATYALSRAVHIPILCSSGVTDVTAPLALAAGAKGVGVGSMINRLATQQQMYLAVQMIADAMHRSPAHHQQQQDQEQMATSPSQVQMHSFPTIHQYD